MPSSSPTATAATLPVADGVSRWVSMTRATQQRDAQLYIIGNGGSAGMASHMATDAVKNGRLRALAFNDSSLLTATANEWRYDQVFSLPLERLGRAGESAHRHQQLRELAEHRPGARSRSGRRHRRRHALGDAARQSSRALGDLNFYVPCRRYGWAESAHQVVLHYWFDQYQDVHGPGAI